MSQAPQTTIAPIAPTAPGNSTIHTLLNHRTVRAFTDEAVPEETIAVLLDAARHAATSSFYQQTTIIRVRNEAIRHQVFEASLQPYVDGRHGELFVFVVDLHRNARIREEAGLPIAPLDTTALFLQGVEDTLIAAQTVVVAAESLGLGTVYLGSIGGDPRLVIKALKLPRHTFPLIGLLVGYPDQSPQLKPRLPAAITTATDTYPEQEDYSVALAEYDQVVQTYYDLRDSSRHVDSFTRQIRTKPGTGRAELAPTLDVLHEQGLALR